MEMFLDILSWLCLLSGGFFAIVGGIGLVRLPDFFTRLHAASITDTLGTMLIMFGLILQAGFAQTSIKLLLIVVFMVVTNPTATHALAKAARHGGLKPYLHAPGGSPKS